jgi:hypothetical protein
VDEVCKQGIIHFSFPILSFIFVVNYLQKSSDTYVSPVKAYVFWWHTKNTFVNVYINYLISLLAYIGLFNPFRHNPSVRSQICGVVVIKRADIEMT